MTCERTSVSKVTGQDQRPVMLTMGHDALDELRDIVKNQIDSTSNWMQAAVLRGDFGGEYGATHLAEIRKALQERVFREINHALHQFEEAHGAQGD